ncbi:hypothetical protein KDRO_F09360 [Kluyveromyces lactis]|nr:hypothetical protein KDRO_F09360 [Kluyveromyces lactis]
MRSNQFLHFTNLQKEDGHLGLTWICILLITVLLRGGMALMTAIGMGSLYVAKGQMDERKAGHAKGSAKSWEEIAEEHGIETKKSGSAVETK